MAVTQIFRILRFVKTKQILEKHIVRKNCVTVCFSYFSWGQLSPSAVREASVMLLQPDTHRICSLWHPRHRLTSPSSVICCRGKDDAESINEEKSGQGQTESLYTIKHCSYYARLNVYGCEFWAVFLKVFQRSVVQLRTNRTDQKQ